MKPSAHVLLLLLMFSVVVGQPTAVVTNIMIAEDDPARNINFLTGIRDMNSCGTGQGTCQLEISNIASSDIRYRTIINSVPPSTVLSATTGCSNTSPCSAVISLTLRDNQNTNGVPLVVTFDIISRPQSGGTAVSSSFQMSITITSVNDAPESSPIVGTVFTFSSYPQPASTNPNVLEVENFATVVRVAPSTAADEDGQILCGGASCPCTVTLLSGASVLSSSPGIELGSYTPIATAPVSGTLRLQLQRPIRGDFPRRMRLSCSITDNGIPQGINQFNPIEIIVTGISIGTVSPTTSCVEDSDCLISNFIPSITDGNGGATRFNPQNWISITSTETVRLNEIISQNGFVPIHNPSSGCDGGCASDLRILTLANKNTFINNVNTPIPLSITVFDNLGNSASPQQTLLSVISVNDPPLYSLSPIALSRLVANYSDVSSVGFPEFTFSQMLMNIQAGPDDELVFQSVRTSDQRPCEVSMPRFQSIDASVVLFDEIPIIQISGSDGSLSFRLRSDLINQLSLFSSSQDNYLLVNINCRLFDSQLGMTTVDQLTVAIIPPNSPPFASCSPGNNCVLSVVEDSVNVTLSNVMELSPRSLFGTASDWESFQTIEIVNCDFNSNLIDFFNITIHQPVVVSSDNYTASIEISLIPNIVNGNGTFSCTVNDSLGLESTFSGEIVVTSVNDLPYYVFGSTSIAVDASNLVSQNVSNIVRDVTAGIPPSGSSNEDNQVVCGNSGICICSVSSGTEIFTSIPTIILESNSPTVSSPTSGVLNFQLSGVLGIATVTCVITDSEGASSTTPLITITSIQQGIVWNFDRAGVVCVEDVSPCVISGLISNLNTIPTQTSVITYSSQVTSTDSRFSQLISSSSLQGVGLSDLRLTLFDNQNTESQSSVVLVITISNNLGNSFSREINFDISSVNDPPIFTPTTAVSVVGIQLQGAGELIFTNTPLVSSVSDVDGPDSEIQLSCESTNVISQVVFFKSNFTIAVQFDYDQLLLFYEQSGRPGFPLLVDITCQATDSLSGSSTVTSRLSITTGKTAFKIEPMITSVEDQGPVVIDNFIKNGTDNKLLARSATSPFDSNMVWYSLTSTDVRWGIVGNGIFMTLPRLELDQTTRTSATLTYETSPDKNTGTTPIRFLVTLTDTTGDQSDPVECFLSVIPINDNPVVGNKDTIERDGLNTSTLNGFLFGLQQQVPNLLSGIFSGPTTAVDELQSDSITPMGISQSCISRSVSGRITSESEIIINQNTATLIFTIEEPLPGRYPIRSDLSFLCQINDTAGGTTTVSIPVHIENGPPTWSPSSNPLLTYEDGSVIAVQPLNDFTVVVFSNFIQNLNGEDDFNSDWEDVMITNSTIINSAMVVNRNCDSGFQPLCTADLSLSLNKNQYGTSNISIAIRTVGGLSHTRNIEVNVENVNDPPSINIISITSFTFNRVAYSAHTIREIGTSVTPGPDLFDYINDLSCIVSNQFLFAVQPVLSLEDDNSTLSLSFTFSDVLVLSESQLSSNVYCSISDAFGSTTSLGSSFTLSVIPLSNIIIMNSPVNEVVCYEDGRQFPVNDQTTPLPCFIQDFVRILNFNGDLFSDPEWSVIGLSGGSEMLINNASLTRLPTVQQPTSDLSLRLVENASGSLWLSVFVRDRPTGRTSQTLFFKVTVLSVNDFPIIMLNSKYLNGIPSANMLSYQLDDFLELAVPGPSDEEITQNVTGECNGIPTSVFSSQPEIVIANRVGRLMFSVIEIDIPNDVSISCYFNDNNKTIPSTPMLRTDLGRIPINPSISFTIPSSVRCFEDLNCHVPNFVSNLRDRNSGLSEFTNPIYSFNSTDDRFSNLRMYLTGRISPVYCTSSNNCDLDLVVESTLGSNTDLYTNSGLVSGSDPIRINISISDVSGRITTMEFSVIIIGNNDLPSYVQSVYEIVIENPQTLLVFPRSDQIIDNLLPGRQQSLSEAGQILCNGQPCLCQSTNTIIFENRLNPVLRLSDYSPAGLVGASGLLEYTFDRTVLSGVVGVQKSIVRCNIIDSVNPNRIITVETTISLVESREQVCGPVVLPSSATLSSSCRNGSFLTSISDPSCTSQCLPGFQLQTPFTGTFSCPAIAGSGIACDPNTCTVAPVVSGIDFSYVSCIGNRTGDVCTVECPVGFVKSDTVRDDELEFELQCNNQGRIINRLNITRICESVECPAVFKFGMIPGGNCTSNSIKNDSSCQIQCDTGFITTTIVSPHQRHTLNSSAYCQVAPQSGTTTLFYNINCTKSCEEYICPSQMSQLPNPELASCPSGICTSSMCCLELCSSFDCVSGRRMLPKINSNGIVCTSTSGCTEEECCDQTCASSFVSDCGIGFTLNDNLNQINCNSTTCTISQCCRSTCDNTAFTYCLPGSGYSLKSGSSSIPCGGPNPQTDCDIAVCCNPTCCRDVEICIRSTSSLVLAAGYESISCPSGTCVESDCCEVSCQNYVCDASQGLTLRDDHQAIGCSFSSGCASSDCCIDRCQGVTCTSVSTCHLPGTCDPTTGTCSNPLTSDGTTCSISTRAGTCSSGRCIATASSIPCGSSSCTDIGQTCVTTRCQDAATGTCGTEVVTVGSSCSDGSFGTVNDICTAATCFGYNTRDYQPCRARSECHEASIVSGVCIHTLKTDLSTCNDQDSTTINDRCLSGKCIGDKKCLRTCKPVPCRISECNPETGLCSYTRIQSDNTICGVSVDEVCISGECVNRNCSCCEQSRSQCLSISCEGNCVQNIIRNGEACTPQQFNDSSFEYYCQQGECRMNVTQVTETFHQCRGLQDGVLCNDQNPTTFPDYCNNGLCIGLDICSRETCPIRECHAIPTCELSQSWQQIASLINPTNIYKISLSDLMLNSSSELQFHTCRYTPVGDNIRCRGGTCLSGICRRELTCYNTTCVTTRSECRNIKCSDAVMECVEENLIDGTQCSIGNCLSGECVSSQAGIVSPCLIAVCERQLRLGLCELPVCSESGCSSITKLNNIPCDDNNDRTYSDKCQSGVCIGQRTCLSNCDRICRANVTCDGISGTCSSQPSPDGSVCITRRSEPGSCQDGWCYPTRQCSLTTTVIPVIENCISVQCYDSSCCDSGCAYTPTPNSICNDNNDATVDDRCIFSEQLNKYYCSGRELCQNKICWPTNSCELQGLCNPLTGECEKREVSDGMPCDDKNVTTIRDACYRGTCIGDDYCTTHCVSQNPCLVAVCSPEELLDADRCVFLPKNGTSCDDLNPNTLNDTCDNGFCSGTINCIPTGGGLLQVCKSTQCHTPSCNSNGQCTLIPSSFNVQCNPNNAASSIPSQRFFGTCISGSCNEDNDYCNGINCVSRSTCTVARCVGYRFNPSNRGSCEAINLPDYTECFNPTANKDGLCLFGTCVVSPTNLTITTQLVPEHRCSMSDNCTDFNVLTKNDSCQSGGFCAGGISCGNTTCVRQSQCHNTFCESNVCIQRISQDFSHCIDYNNNTISSHCRSGVCIPNDRCQGVFCQSLITGESDQNNSYACVKPSPFLVNSSEVILNTITQNTIPGICDSSTGRCVDLFKLTIPVQEGTACNITDQGGRSMMGACRRGRCILNSVIEIIEPQTCPHESIICNNIIGVNCSEVRPVSDGTPCSDYSPFTSSGSCQNGVCISTDSCEGVTCVPSSDCHHQGECAFGVCTTPTVSDYTDCGNNFFTNTDDNNITQSWCVSGICRPKITNPCTSCTQPDAAVLQCYSVVQNRCDNRTGVCEIIPKPINTICDDFDSDTDTDICVTQSTGQLKCLGSITCNGQRCQNSNQCLRPYCSGNICTSIPVENTIRKQCDDGNPLTRNDICINGECTGELICDSSTCGSDTDCQISVGCLFGSCVRHNKPDFTNCDDGISTTARDHCRNGLCVGIQISVAIEDGCPLTRSSCQSPNQFIRNPISSNTADYCSENPLPDLIVCDDNNPDTVMDTCDDGVCVGVLYCPEMCKSSSACKKPVCRSGVCTLIDLPDGTMCVDYNQQTGEEVCMSGVCVGNHKCVSDLCQPESQCHIKGSCQLDKCTTPIAPDGTPCDDGNPTTTMDICTRGICVGQPRCTTSSSQCNQIGNSLTNCLTTTLSQNCTIGSPVCVTQPTPDGGSCNDQNTLTVNDTCYSGVCVGLIPCGNQVCSSQGICQNPICVSSNQCGLSPKPDNTPCYDGNDTTINDICVSGRCVGTSLCQDKDCPERECFESGCDINTGDCFLKVRPNKTPCNDNNQNTFDDMCDDGICIGTAFCSNSNQCTTTSSSSSSSSCILSSYCNQFSGSCEISYIANGTECVLNNNASGVCESGVCSQQVDLPCSDNCSTTITQCIVNNCYGDVCSSSYATIGTACNDHIDDTMNDRCTSHGLCSGRVLCRDSSCNPQSQCHYSGTCDSATGVCSNPQKPDLSPCDDLNPTTVRDSCLNGICVGIPQGGLCNNVICGVNTLSCRESIGICNPQNGICEYAIRSDGQQCDDSNSISLSDRCHSGVCVGTVPCLENCESLSWCMIAVCRQSRCQMIPKLDGTQCDDSNPLTQNDICTSGTCLGQVPQCMTTTYECNTTTVCINKLTTITTTTVTNSLHGTPCDGGDSTTTGSACSFGICIGFNKCLLYRASEKCDIRKQCSYTTTCDSETGSCREILLPDNTDCDDGNVLTISDKCFQGHCRGELIQTTCPTCRSSSQCHIASCENSVCTQTQAPDGFQCNDLNPSTINDRCTSGICIGTDLCQGISCVETSNSFSCFESSNTNCYNGVCYYEYSPSDKVCDDLLSVTTTDVCTPGGCGTTTQCGNQLCTSSNPQCHYSLCQNNICVEIQKPDNTECYIPTTVGRLYSYSLPAVGTMECQSGICVSTSKCFGVFCSSLTQCHLPGVCLESSGECTNPTKPTTACDDGNPTTINDVCTNGVCQGRAPCDGISCVDVTNGGIQSCYESQGRCNTTTSLCEYNQKPDGTVCDDGNTDTETDICRSGVCSGTLICSSSTQTNQCTPDMYQNNECLRPSCSGSSCVILTLNGSLCNDKDPNTANDICSTTGVCRGVPLCDNILNTCTPLSDCYRSECTFGRCRQVMLSDGMMCFGGQCQEGVCRIGNCPLGNCQQRRCSSTVEDSPCDDGNPITINDRCRNGFCIGESRCNSVTCTSLSQCHERGSCNPQTGRCSTPTSADNTPCDDSNPTTVIDVCTSGTCSGQLQCLREPSPCSPPSECKEVNCGSDGRCLIRNKYDHSSCRSPNFECLGGTCIQKNRCSGVVCTPSDSCHSTGSCDPETGYCSDPLLGEGTPCVVGNYTSTCSGNGVCIRKNNCSSVATPGGCHTNTRCKTVRCTTEGLCVIENEYNFTKCNDGNPETINDNCINGICVGTNLCNGHTCGSDNQLLCMSSSNSCNRLTGLCEQRQPLQDGSTCTDYNTATVHDSCQAGSCVGTTTCSGETCKPSDQYCMTSTCSDSDGCGYVQLPNGVACDDYNQFTTTDRCLNGVCVGINLCQNVTCSLPTDSNTTCFDSTTCDYQTGKCLTIPKPDMTFCKHQNAESGVCIRGLCSPLLKCDSQLRTTPVECPEISVVSSLHPCIINTCPGIDTNTCIQRNQLDGVSCLINNPQTGGILGPGFCRNGVCVSSITQDRTCRAGQCRSDQCQDSTCDVRTGNCQIVNKNQHEQCDDGNSGTTTDSCVGDGSCQGETICNGQSCGFNSQCSTYECKNGICITTNKPSGTPCNDNLSETMTDSCNGEGTCVGISICSFLSCNTFPLLDCNSAPFCDVSLQRCLYTPLTDYTSCGNSTGICMGGSCLVNSTQNCGTVEHCAPTNPQCETVSCVNSNCVQIPKLNGTACTDYNPNTLFDYCYEGRCIGIDLCENVTCPEVRCQINNFCQHHTGTCYYIPMTDGSSCNNNNKCFSGVCLSEAAPQCGSSGVQSTCPKPNDVRCQDAICHQNGTCILSNKFDGTPCDDLSQFSVDDKCVSGQCIGQQLCNNRFCDNQDFGGSLNPCNTPSICNYTTGGCISSCNSESLQCKNAQNGTTCTDNNPSTINDKCVSEICIGSNQCDDITCDNSIITNNRCIQRVDCNPLTGLCEQFYRPEMTPCSDNDPTTTQDVCIAGSCVGRVPCGGSFCPLSEKFCKIAVCLSNNTCSEISSENGIWCTDDNPMTTSDSCNNGLCTGVSLCNSASCDLSQHHQLNSQCYDDNMRCNPQSGQCLVTEKQYQTTCTDGNPFTQNDTCLNGTCSGLLTCSDTLCVTHEMCKMAICNTTCFVINRFDGYPCTDNNETTGLDVCMSGVCVGSNLCEGSRCSIELSDRTCHQSATCNPQTGQCEAVLLPNGTTCVDHSTGRNGICFSGSCKPDTICGSERCQNNNINSCYEYDCGLTATPTCRSIPSPDNVYCGTVGRCKNGICVETAPAIQNRYITPDQNTNPCIEETCNLVSGVCSSTVVSNGTECYQNITSSKLGTCHLGTCLPDVSCGSMFTCYNLYLQGVLGSELSVCQQFECTSGVNGACVRTPSPRGTLCGRSGECINGICVQNGLSTCQRSCKSEQPTALDCIASDGSVQKPDGEVCNTLSGRCYSGVCTSEVLCGDYKCFPNDIQCQVAVCVSGQCSSIPAIEGKPCNDFKTITTGDRCIAGKCIGIDLCRNVICSATNNCHFGGTCNPSTGLCSSPRKPTNTECDDNNSETPSSYCLSGICVGVIQCGIPAVSCQPTRTNCFKIECQGNGCVTTQQPDGTLCDDENIQTQNDTCNSGLCSGSIINCATSVGIQSSNILSQQCQVVSNPESVSCNNQICTDLTCCQTCVNYNTNVCKCRALQHYPNQITCPVGGCNAADCCSSPIAISNITLETTLTLEQLNSQMTKQKLISDIHNSLSSLGTDRYMIEDTWNGVVVVGVSGSVLRFQIASRLYTNNNIFTNLVKLSLENSIRNGRILSARRVLSTSSITLEEREGQNPVVLVSMRTTTDAEIFSNPLRSSELSSYKSQLSSSLDISTELISAFTVGETTRMPPQTQITYSVTPCAFSATEARLDVQKKLQQLVADLSNVLGIKSFTASGVSGMSFQAVLYISFTPDVSGVVSESGPITTGQQTAVVRKFYSDQRSTVASFLISGSGGVVTDSCVGEVDTAEFERNNGVGTMYYQYTISDTVGIHLNSDSWSNSIRQVVNQKRSQINIGQSFKLSIIHHETEPVTDSCSSSPCNCGQRCRTVSNQVFSCECRHPHFSSSSEINKSANCSTKTNTLSTLSERTSTLSQLTPEQISQTASDFENITRQLSLNVWHGDGRWRQDALQIARQLSFHQNKNISIESDLINVLQYISDGTNSLYTQCCLGSSTPTFVSCCGVVTSVNDTSSVSAMITSIADIMLRASPQQVTSNTMITCDSESCVDMLKDSFLMRRNTSLSAQLYVGVFHKLASLRCVSRQYTTSESVSEMDTTKISTIVIQPVGNVGTVVDERIISLNSTTGLELLVSHSSGSSCVEIVLIPTGSLLHSRFQGSGFPHLTPMNSIISVGVEGTIPTAVFIQNRGPSSQWIPTAHDTFSTLTFNSDTSDWQPSTGIISSVTPLSVSGQYFNQITSQQRSVVVLAANSTKLYSLSGFELPDDYDCFPCISLPIVWGLCFILLIICSPPCISIASSIGFPDCCSRPRESFAGFRNHMWIQPFYSETVSGDDDDDDDDDDENSQSRLVKSQKLCHFIILCWCQVSIFYPTSTKCRYSWNVDTSNVAIYGIVIGFISTLITQLPTIVSKIQSNKWIFYIPTIVVSFVCIGGSVLMYDNTDEYNTTEQIDRYVTVFGIALGVSLVVIEPVGKQLLYWIGLVMNKSKKVKIKTQEFHQPVPSEHYDERELVNLPVEDYSGEVVREVMPRLYQEPYSTSRTQSVLNSGSLGNRHSSRYTPVLDVYGDYDQQTNPLFNDPHFSNLRAPPPAPSGRGVLLSSLPTSHISTSSKYNRLSENRDNKLFSQFGVCS